MSLTINSHNTSKILGLWSFNLGDCVNEKLAVTMCHKAVNV